MLYSVLYTTEYKKHWFAPHTFRLQAHDLNIIMYGALGTLISI